MGTPTEHTTELAILEKSCRMRVIAASTNTTKDGDLAYAYESGYENSITRFCAHMSKSTFVGLHEDFNKWLHSVIVILESEAISMSNTAIKNGVRYHESLGRLSALHHIRRIYDIQQPKQQKESA